ncbi:1-deoxy-D-xylulose-5-phosphate reductoisomerase [Thermomicrobium sp. 4228-Ro]|uniref:1-deoxy-D-xylulose-5-phosphate reductoisomerase n=1 Tax=Thermomicrobium sp. 4228-Ro TaxID=2993937 RepID=UPI002248C1E6|nr:1-deoxy-D-xylulose-5-phosphate reductoisomerase [Thermomicrobium sp. 4228-Ro]MCX2727713.1 1-deoxy-D-xylulose-5-phosphate reductoisomerase [Thermomicrobium sp. 4228-Ro]
MRLRLSILGSTGSIGRQTLEVVDAHADRFEVVALAARRESALLASQVARYRPRLVVVAEPTEQRAVSAPTVMSGPEGLVAAATLTEADIVVIALAGQAGVRPTLAAAAAGKCIALANKESVVCAGELLMRTASEHGATIRPIDSEHSALWQLLHIPHRREELDRVIITASGGPFRTTPLERLEAVTPAEALAHPTWRMGPKITIDSATLMNKGLEIIEAHWLFDLPFELIDVVIHPQSILHAIVSFRDGSTLAHAAYPDMRVPIQYALLYPERPPGLVLPLDLATISKLEFFAPDPARFPALELAREVGRAGSTYPTVLSASDEVAVQAFLEGRIRFTDIVPLVRRVVEQHRPLGAPLTLDAILEADQWARCVTEEEIARLAVHR